MPGLGYIKLLLCPVLLLPCFWALKANFLVYFCANIYCLNYCGFLFYFVIFKGHYLFIILLCPFFSLTFLIYFFD